MFVHLLFSLLGYRQNKNTTDGEYVTLDEIYNHFD